MEPLPTRLVVNPNRRNSALISGFTAQVAQTGLSATRALEQAMAMWLAHVTFADPTPLPTREDDQ